jgi:hypothetical protein
MTSVEREEKYFMMTGSGGRFRCLMYNSWKEDVNPSRVVVMEEVKNMFCTSQMMMTIVKISNTAFIKSREVGLAIPF